MTLEHGERDDLQRTGVGGGKRNGRGDPGVETLEPARGADAPTVTGLQTGEVVLGHWSRKIVAGSAAVIEELRGDLDADRVAALIFGAGVAVTIAKEAGERGR